MIYERFEHLLKQAIGLDAKSVGASAISRAVEARARARNIADPDRYWDQVSSDEGELQALVEAVVVPETWFFRDREAFTAAAKLLRAEWQARVDAPPLRLLSLPCSTGEEPYTMAMALLDAGLPAAAFRIDAIDVSGQSLQHARTGVYGRNSFRGTDLAFRACHFTETREGHRVSDAVRAPVHFARANLFDLGRWEDGIFDVVFCRNLLIYFDPADQKRAVALLRRLLATHGTLFVGHSEASLLLGEGFAPVRIPLAFAFRKQDGAAANPTRRAAKPRPIVAPVAARPAPRAVARPAAPAAPPAGIDQIRAAADSGDVKTALALGAALLKQGQPTAEALHLLGVISDAAGDTASAADYYRKTLYLDPGHHEALTHLALLLEKQGDRAGALRMRERARRLDARRAG